VNLNRICFFLALSLLPLWIEMSIAVQPPSYSYGDPHYTYCRCFHDDLEEFVLDVSDSTSLSTCTDFVTYNSSNGPNMGTVKDCVAFDNTTMDGSGLAIRSFPGGTVLSSIPSQTILLPQEPPPPDAGSD
jgi:hypothetical protein